MGGGRGKTPGVVFHTYPLNKKKGVRYIIHNVQIVIKERKEKKRRRKERLRGAVTNRWRSVACNYITPPAHPSSLAIPRISSDLLWHFFFNLPARSPLYSYRCIHPVYPVYAHMNLAQTRRVYSESLKACPPVQPPFPLQCG